MTPAGAGTEIKRTLARSGTRSGIALQFLDLVVPRRQRRRRQLVLVIPVVQEECKFLQ